MVGRVSTFVLTDRMNSNNLRLQSEMARANMQISSGKKGFTYADIGRDTLRLLNIQNDLSRIKTQNIVASNVSARIQQMYSIIDNMIELANGFVSTLAQSQSGNLAVPAEVENVARNTQEALASLLNINFGGRYLFAGDQLSTPPVDLTDPAYTPQPAPPAPSVVNTGYYQGDNGMASAEVSDGFMVNYGVTADNAAFEKLFRALNLAANHAADSDARGAALDLAKEAINDMAALQTDLSAKQNLIAKQVASNEDDEALFKSVVSDIADTDVAEATIRLTQYETQLEASYSAMTRSMRLRLSNFL